MDPKSALGGPKPIARTGRSLLKYWSYTSNPCIYFSILQDWRSHLAKSLFILHKYLKFIKRADIKNCIGPTYKKPKPWKSAFIKISRFEINRDPCPLPYGYSLSWRCRIAFVDEWVLFEEWPTSSTPTRQDPHHLKVCFWKPFFHQRSNTCLPSALPCNWPGWPAAKYCYHCC